MAAASGTSRIRSGPTILSLGFRPFFLLAGIWAALSMAIWLAVLAGRINLPTAFDPLDWHAHELLFGYLGAVIAGFLLTAVPNWTGRAPLVGWPLLGLVLLWLAGRVAVGFSAYIPALAVALADLAFPVVLALVILREIVAGKNWHNLVVLAMLLTLGLGNLLFHIEAAGGGLAAGGIGLRLGLGAAVMMIAVIGGRIVPAFTRNWLVKRGHPARPAALGRFDKAVMLTTLGALGLWVAFPESALTGLSLLGIGILHILRLSRWSTRHTSAEPLVWILHVGYGFVPLGALALGAAALWADRFSGVAAQHLWMAGATGVMTLAVMTRATLGHSGRALTAGPGTRAIYAALLGSVLARAAAGFLPEASSILYSLSGVLWVAAFLGFAVIFGPALMRKNPP